MRYYKIAARQLTQLLAESPAMTFEEVGAQLHLKDHEVPDILWHVRKRLEQNHTPTILVTQFYFDLNREPRPGEEAVLCCALHGRAAAGIRLLCITKNDILASTWLKLNQRNARGIQTHNIDRIAVAHSEHKLSRGQSHKLIEEMRREALPYHEEEYAALVGKHGKLK